MHDAVDFEGQLGAVEEMLPSTLGLGSLILHYVHSEKQKSAGTDVKHNALVGKMVCTEDRYHTGVHRATMPPKVGLLRTAFTGSCKTKCLMDENALGGKGNTCGLEEKKIRNDCAGTKKKIQRDW